MSVLTQRVQELNVPPNFELLGLGEWSLGEAGPGKPITAVMGADFSVVTFISNPDTNRYYLGNFGLPSSTGKGDGEAFENMLEAVTEHEEDSTRLGAYVSGAALLGTKGVDGVQVDDLMRAEREFTFNALSEILPVEAIYDEWLPKGCKVNYAGVVPDGKFFRTIGKTGLNQNE